MKLITLLILLAIAQNCLVDGHNNQKHKRVPRATKRHGTTAKKSFKSTRKSMFPIQRQQSQLLTGRDDTPSSADSQPAEEEDPRKCPQCIERPGLTADDGILGECTSNEPIATKCPKPKGKETEELHDADNNGVCVAIRYMGGGIAYGCDTTPWIEDDVRRVIREEIEEEMKLPDASVYEYNTEYTLSDTKFGGKVALVALCWQNKCIPSVKTQNQRFCRMCGFIGDDFQDMAEGQFCMQQERAATKSRRQKGKRRRSSSKRRTFLDDYQFQSRYEEQEAPVDCWGNNYRNTTFEKCSARPYHSTEYGICNGHDNDCFALVSDSPSENEGDHSVFGCKNQMEAYLKAKFQDYDEVLKPVFRHVRLDSPICLNLKAKYSGGNGTTHRTKRKLCACPNNLCDPVGDGLSDGANQIIASAPVLIPLVIALWMSS